MLIFSVVIFVFSTLTLSPVPFASKSGGHMGEPPLIVGHFGDESFQSITSTGTDNLTRTTQRQNIQITQNKITRKRALVNSTTDTLKNSRLRERTDRAWFSRRLRHPARKRNGSILTAPEPARTGAL